MSQSPQKPVEIRFCVNNARGLKERNELIALGFDCRDCLGDCSACFDDGRFLEIDGEIVRGEFYNEILQALPQYTGKMPGEK